MKLKGQVRILLSALLFCGVAMAQQPAGEQGNSAKVQDAKVQDIVTRMVRAQAENRDRYRAYTVTREYKLFSDHSSEANSRVIADVSFVPPGTKEYAIRNRVGGGQGEKVVRKVLDHEQEIAADWESSALTAENYDFTLVGQERVGERNCYVLDLKPKRDSRDLIRGRAWIDAQTFNIQRVSGEPVKNPSWWVKNVQLTLTFGDVDGMWLQTGAKADADVRFFGKHVLTARDMDYRVSSVAAAKQIPQPARPSRNYAGALGAGMILAH